MFHLLVWALHGHLQVYVCGIEGDGWPKVVIDLLASHNTMVIWSWI